MNLYGSGLKAGWEFTMYKENINNNRYNNPAILAIFVVCSSIFVYANSLSGEFIWDDVEQIVENPVIMDLHNVPSFFTSDLWKLISNPAVGSNYYRPLFLLSLATDYSLWGLNPLGYHITNIILHALVSLLVYLIGRKLLGNNISAFVAGLLFAVHPVHVESVAWISGRTDPMAAAFMLLSLYLYILFSERKRVIVLLLSFTAYIFSLLSKEMGITLPLLIVAYEFSFNKNKPGESSLKSLWPIGVYVLISAAYLYIRGTILGDAVGVNSSSSPLHMRIYTSFGIIVDYIRLIVLPINMKALYDVPLRESFFDWKVLLPLSLLLSLLIVTYLLYKKDKMAFFASIWFFITILPVSNIVPLKPTMMAERYIYIPSVGICLIAAYLYLKLHTWSFLSKYSKPALIIILATLSMVTIHRGKLWSNEKLFFEQSVKDAPGNAYAHHNLGDIYRKNGNMEKAIEEWETAVLLYPLHPEANNSLANIALMQGKYHDAITRYRIALEGRPENSEAHYNLGMAFEKLGNMEEAAMHYREFIRMASPKHKEVVEELKRKIKSYQ